MKINTLETKCFEYFLENNPSKIASIPNFIQEELFNVVKDILGKKNIALNDELLANFSEISFFRKIDLSYWKISSLVLDKLGKNLTKLCLSQFTDENDGQKLLTILSNNPNLEILELQGVRLPEDFIACCKGLKNLKVLKLKHCTGVDFPKLLELFSEESGQCITNLALPPLDLNDKLFPELLQKCGENLQYLYLEHKENGQEIHKRFQGRKIKKFTYPYSGEIMKITHLYKLGIVCPNLKKMTFVNIRFDTNCWLTPNYKGNYEHIWENIMGSLTQLNQLKFKNYNTTGYKNMLSFLAKMDLASLQKLVIKKFPIKDSTIKAIQENNPHLKYEIKECDIWTEKS